MCLNSLCSSCDSRVLCKFSPTSDFCFYLIRVLLIYLSMFPMLSASGFKLHHDHDILSALVWINCPIYFILIKPNTVSRTELVTASTVSHLCGDQVTSQFKFHMSQNVWGFSVPCHTALVIWIFNYSKNVCNIILRNNCFLKLFLYYQGRLKSDKIRGLAKDQGSTHSSFSTGPHRNKFFLKNHKISIWIGLRFFYFFIFSYF